MENNGTTKEFNLEEDAKVLLKWYFNGKQGEPPESLFSLYDRRIYLENNKYMFCLGQTPKATVSFGYRPTEKGLAWLSETN